MTAKMTHEKAAEEILGYGFVPDETYTGTTMRAWRMHCVDCGQGRRVRVAVLRAGFRCGHFFTRRDESYRQILRDCGFLVSSTWTGKIRDQCPVACAACGAEQSWSVRQAQLGRAVCACIAHKDKVQEMKDAGYHVTGPFPGHVHDPWPSVCTGCGMERRASLATVRAGNRCKHQRPTGPPL